MTEAVKVKNDAFEYLTYKLIEWYEEKNNASLDEFLRCNDFSKLKLLKLLFFVSAIKCESNELLDIFNQFHALPYGHVETDIYASINNDALKIFAINSTELRVKKKNIEVNIQPFCLCYPQIQEQLDVSIDELKNVNYNIIDYAALELVDLSHNWFSWKSMFQVARDKNSYKAPIPSSLIKREPKLFIL